MLRDKMSEGDRGLWGPPTNLRTRIAFFFCSEAMWPGLVLVVTLVLQLLGAGPLLPSGVFCFQVVLEILHVRSHEINYQEVGAIASEGCATAP